ncbi:hypothetical protein [Changchengzhania lutea]|uniref:hypothetical protein n=1 Tax=Changchengzhania lutea TaxID=2049305 RepID=UPI00115E02C7|nr:hypothetical protein [Changchengzhania lutea]
MKTLTLILFFCINYVVASNTEALTQDLPEIGDVLIINKPSGHIFNHISFPRLNFIVKRGGLASYKTVLGNQVIVKDVIIEDNDVVYVVLERKKGKKFFGFLQHVKADYSKSLDSGEIYIPKGS